MRLLRASNLSETLLLELVSPPLQMPLRALQAPACGSLLLLRAVFFSEILDLAGIELMVGAMGRVFACMWESGRREKVFLDSRGEFEGLESGRGLSNGGIGYCHWFLV
ncbi:hypothetical protein NC652_038246 [Populus alba x Populus x berolinensis]|nr:hypothetical protein NC652_038246 [Populus alba x Populus x berolinensis]